MQRTDEGFVNLKIDGREQGGIQLLLSGSAAHPHGFVPHFRDGVFTKPVDLK
jgi:uncharacterized protein YwbE